MKLKEQKKLGILYLVLGAALFLIGLLTDAGEKTNWLSSFGSAIAVVGAARLLRVYRLTRALWRFTSAFTYSSPQLSPLF